MSSKYGHSAKEIGAAICVGVNKLGCSHLHPNQDLVVRKFVQGLDIFVSLPTGSGKSLCYCILPFVFDVLRQVEKSSIAVVVSPLVALMKDQVASMCRRGCMLETGDEETIMDVCNGQFQLVYMSPESLLTNIQWRDMLQSPFYQENLVAFVVDEAHCVKKWGETFRRELLNLGEARSLVPADVHIMALTATATQKTRRQVCKVLGMVHPFFVSVSPNRSNIKYIVKHSSSMEETFASLVEEIRQYHKSMGKTIIFCRSYDDCSHIYMFLKSCIGRAGLEPRDAPDCARFRLVDMYTACTHAPVKEAILKSFCDLKGNLRVVVATVAFSMGLDCPNVRRVIHWGSSSDIELYIQEMGRAGRDGLPSEAILYYIPSPANRFVEEPMRDYCKNKDRCRR